MSRLVNELYLRRLSVEDALLLLDRFLNDAFLADISPVRVIHGKGQGILRQAVHSQLKSHPLVRSYRIAEFGEGESGVTLVELVERGALKQQR